MYDLKKDKDYRIVQFAKTNTDGTKQLAEIELLSGKYTGVRYNYGDVSGISENTDDEYATIAFEYFLTEALDFSNLEDDEDFKNYLGEVLVSMILTSMEEKKAIDEVIQNMKILDTESGEVLNNE